MKWIKIGLALWVSVIGVLLPWRLRILYSELLGWVAQLVPPDLYQMDEQPDTEASSPPPAE